MPRNLLLLLLIFFAIATTGLNAMNPQIRLPEWNQTEFAIAEWNPEQGILVIRVQITASSVTLRHVSSKLHISGDLSMKPDIRERKILKKGDKAVFMHRLNAKAGFSGWIEIDLRAQPDQIELLELVKKTHADAPITGKILEEEAKAVNQPIPIGVSLPIMLRSDLAMSCSPEMAFRAEHKAGRQCYYMWYPPDGIGKGITAEGIRAFVAAIKLNSLVKAEAAAAMLIKKFQTYDEPLTLEKENDEKFAIPGKMVIELINANMLTLRAIVGNNTAELEAAIANMKPGFTRPFLLYNLGELYSAANQKAKAAECFRKALADLPVWPGLISRLKK
jgi:tetratricopeptide (TPR) repeat protein